MEKEKKFILELIKMIEDSISNIIFLKKSNPKNSQVCNFCEKSIKVFEFKLSEILIDFLKKNKKEDKIYPIILKRLGKIKTKINGYSPTPTVDEIKDMLSVLKEKNIKLIISVCAGKAFVEWFIQTVSDYYGYGIKIVATDGYKTTTKPNDNIKYIDVLNMDAYDAIMCKDNMKNYIEGYKNEEICIYAGMPPLDVHFQKKTDRPRIIEGFLEAKFPLFLSLVEGPNMAAGDNKFWELIENNLKIVYDGKRFENNIDGPNYFFSTHFKFYLWSL